MKSLKLPTVSKFSECSELTDRSKTLKETQTGENRKSTPSPSKLGPAEWLPQRGVARKRRVLPLSPKW